MGRQNVSCSFFYKGGFSLYLKTVHLLHDNITDYNTYPFAIPTIRTLEKLSFTNAVTFFVGENGSGKSTLLEAIADCCEFNVAGGGRNNQYDVHAAESALGPLLRLSWMPKINNGFFLRAESFYQFASYLDKLQDEDPRTLDSYGGKSLHEQSHGESFLSLFNNRFNGKAIYLLDEPEAALSPQRQLALLKIMHDLVVEGSQFIIATHSPILLGFPNATIYHFEETIEEIAYDDVPHVQLTKYFLSNKDRFLQQLLHDE